MPYAKVHIEMNHIRTLVAIGAIAWASTAGAISIDVYALNNSASGGTGANVFNLAAGQGFSLSVSPTDLWSAGGLPRWSNADGLIADLFATGSDESGQAAGVKIGQNFGTYTKSGLTAPYGALVGRIGAGDFFLVGTSYNGVAANSGMLQLFYWDENNFDNSQQVAVTVNAVSSVPDGGTTMALLGLGLVSVSAIRRRI
jgi:hypothetical protein